MARSQVSWVRLAIPCVLLLCRLLPAAPLDEATRQLARATFQQLIEINTTDSVGSTTVAAQAMANRLLDAGFAPEDVQVLGPNDRKDDIRAHGKDERVRVSSYLMCATPRPHCDSDHRGPPG